MNINYSFAGIEYIGVEGISGHCKNAILRLIQCRTKIVHAKILSHVDSDSVGTHCFLLTLYDDNLVAVKSGFSSGYRGEGPRAFSFVLQILDSLGVKIDEYSVDKAMIGRLDMSALTENDINYVNETRPVWPLEKWREYILWNYPDRTELWREFKPVVPFAIIDRRILDLAINFFENPDNSLITGYRRLEDIVRQRTGLQESSTQLFSQAFLMTGAPLVWTNLDPSEQKGRGQLFTAAFLSYRNRRGHREQDENPKKELAEFLLLNQLYVLEAEAVHKDDAS